MIFNNQTPRTELIDVALGNKKADKVIKGGKVVNVHTSEIYQADIAIKGTRIAYVGDVNHTIGDDTEIIDATGQYLSPGMIETHQHVGGSQLTMTEFAKTVLAHGTTGIITDFYEIGIVRGKKAIRFCLDELKATPLKPYFQLASQIFVQNGPFGNTDQVTEEDLYEMLNYPECIGVSEWPANMIAEKDEVVTKLISKTLELGKLNLGHDSETPDRILQAYTCMGHSSSHECVTVQEAIERSRLGLTIMIRQGTAAQDIDNMSKAIFEHRIDPRCFTICTDEAEVAELHSLGHLDYKVRGLIERGVNPIAAIQMASINAAIYAGVDSDVGSIVPGKIADILFISDLPHYKVDKVMANGEIVAENYVYIKKLESPVYPSFAYNTVSLPKERMEADDFKIPCDINEESVTVNVIGQRNGLLVTEWRKAEMNVVNGFIPADTSKDVLKLVRIDRYNTSNKWSVAFVHGYGLKTGAMGNTWNGQKEDIFIVGVDDEDIAVVANRLKEIGGGFVIAKEGKVVSEVRLPLFGLLSDRPLNEVVLQILDFNKAVKEMGCTFDGPMTQLALMGVPIEIGKLKLSEFGLVDVWEGKFVDVIDR